MDELIAILNELRVDYNSTHYVRNDTFKAAADKIHGPTRRLFIDFLERACITEFSGFLLFKELGRRLKKCNPVVAEIFLMLSRDEARHAGFLNKAMTDFGLALDLGFLTKNRSYTFFKPKYIFYATFLSEKIGYWRYITIYRHLQRSPDKQLYPLFDYIENWSQDENRHGDFFAAIFRAHPHMTAGLQGRLWSRFFSLAVFVTMFLNDHARPQIYHQLGLDPTTYNRHVIRRTTYTTARVFPEVWDTDDPAFWRRMDRLVALNSQLAAVSKGGGPLAAVKKVPILAAFAVTLLAMWCGRTRRAGSVDVDPSYAPVY